MAQSRNPAFLLRMWFFLFLFCIPSAAQRGALTVPENLSTLTARAQTIVRGTVAYARVEKHPELTNLWTVVVTVRVKETLKGNASGLLTFRQFIWDIRDRYDAAGYKKGQEMLLLLNKPSEYGLTSPAGMEQGRFRILRDEQGRETAVNGRSNVGLFQDMRAPAAKLSASASKQLSQHRQGPIPLDDLKEIISGLAGSQ